MSHALVTIVAPLPESRIHDADALIDQLGNPPRPDLKAALDDAPGTHFCSLHAIRSKTPGKAYLAFEFSADGTESEATARIAQAIGRHLAPIFALASDWTNDIAAYLESHRIKIGVGLLSSPGLAFAGTPGLSVPRIRAEQRLAKSAAEALAQLPETTPALDRIERIRNDLAADPAFAPLLETAIPAPPYDPPDTAGLIGALALSFVATYLWPVLILLALLTLTGGLLNPGFIGGALRWLLVGALVAIAAVLVAIILGYLELRSLERRDSVENRLADPETLKEMFRRENHYAQNHMLSVTQRKPGLVRWFTARLIFWVILQLATRKYPPGFLGDIGSIHFARWVTVPGTHDLLFFSNFDASWESYLEDFITKAHAGLTGVWSNSIGFPVTENLIQKGATDGERFKRYARQSMQPTRFWYSAYPDLTTVEIRTNAAIRRGLAGALTEDEAISWLALFGSAARPETKLVTSQIQSIVFGGLGSSMPCGACLLVDLPDTVAEARAWLAALLPHIAFDDGRRLTKSAVVTLALGPEGLRRLGLPEPALATFPYAFLGGPTDPDRARILGDTGPNDPGNWRWGHEAPHAALLVYGKSETDIAALESTLGAPRHRVPLKTITQDRSEPFGFADGISQPIIRGTYKGLKSVDPIHLVQPGEFILGYPDNRGNKPPGPTLPSTADPANRLPLVDDDVARPAAPGDAFSRNVVDTPRDLGRNGTYLVIRELEQDVAGFRAYCQRQAARLRDALPEPYDITEEFIASRLIGRWRNGSSTTRHPYHPKHDHPDHPTERPTTASTAPVERPAKPSHLADNDFLFGTEDPEALRCPFGAHIRRANPRDSLSPGSQEQIDISNRHRIIRIGRQIQPGDNGKRGLFFMCLNADLERQFEFVQQTWLRNPSFHGLSAERDPFASDAQTGFTIPTRYGPLRLDPIPAVVATKGAGYFFLPGKRLLEFLATASPHVQISSPANPPNKANPK